MGRHFWGSEAQRQTLLMFKGDYNTARIVKKTRKFWPRFFTVWFNQYPEDRLIKRLRMAQCKTYMGNHTGTREDGIVFVPPEVDAPPPPNPPPPPPPPSLPRGSKSRRERRQLRRSSRDSKILALIRGRSKRYTLPLHQAYSHLYYDKIEHIIEAAWKDHVNFLKKSNSTYNCLSDEQVAELAKDERLNIVNRELRRLYKEETNEVKQEVSEYRQKYALGDSINTSEAERRANAIKNTASLMKSLLPCLLRETGMTVTVLAAGRSPSSDSIVFRSYHVGKGEFGENFAQWLPNWDTAVKDQYIKYFQSVETATMEAAENPVPSVGRGVLLKSRSADGNDEDEGAEPFEEFGGMCESEEDDEQAKGIAEELGGKKKGRIDWHAVFKANRLARGEIDVEISEHVPRSADPPPSTPHGAPNSTQEPRSPNPPPPSTPQKMPDAAGEKSSSRNVPPTVSSPPKEPSATGEDPRSSNISPAVSPQRRSSSVSQCPPRPTTPAVSDDDSASRPLSQHNINGDPDARGQKRKEVDDDNDVSEDVPYVVTAIEFLEKVLGGRCPTLLPHWEMFEEMKHYPESRTKKLGSDKLRPRELTELLVHHDYSNLPIPQDPVQFGKEWRTWYVDAQPSCRGSTWPLKETRLLPSSCNWKALSHGGRNGILVAILGLAMWLLSAESLKTSAGRKITQEIEEALRDVDSVILTMLHENDKENGARTPGRPAKRNRRK